MKKWSSESRSVKGMQLSGGWIGISICDILNLKSYKDALLWFTEFVQNTGMYALVGYVNQVRILA